MLFNLKGDPDSGHVNKYTGDWFACFLFFAENLRV